jgi:hypothetical protein
MVSAATSNTPIKRFAGWQVWSKRPVVHWRQQSLSLIRIPSGCKLMRDNRIVTSWAWRSCFAGSP